MRPEEVSKIIGQLRDAADGLADVRTDFLEFPWPPGRPSGKRIAMRKAMLERIALAEANIRNALAPVNSSLGEFADYRDPDRSTFAPVEEEAR